MILSNPAVCTRYTLENVLKLNFPCNCHLSPFESETYKAYFTVENPNDNPQRISQINVVCSNCGQSFSYNVMDRWMTEYDVNDL